MADPQGLITFANIPPECVISGELTFSHGLNPSTATINTVPMPQIPDWEGDLGISYGSVSLKFPGCRMLDVSQRIDERGTRWVIRILDRRWKWKFGRIRARYNLREAPMNRVMPRNEKQPEELIEELLDALGESNWNLINIPNDVRPFVDWDEGPTGALQRLLDSLGCRLWIDPETDVVTVSRVGVGNPLPNLPEIMQDTLTCAPAVPPESLQFIAGKTLYQDDLELEAVGYEPIAGTNVFGIAYQAGEVLPIDQLSYMPTSWTDTDPYTMSNVDKQFRNAALDCIWKWYRIKVPMAPDTWSLNITNLAQIRPLEAAQLQWHLVDGEKVPLPPIVYGEWDKGHSDYETPEKTVETPHGLFARVTDGFSLDTQRGIVKFSEQKYCSLGANKKPGAGSVRNPNQVNLDPAKLWLRIAFGVRDPDTDAWQRFTVPHPTLFTPGSLTTHWVAREDEFVGYYWECGFGSVQVKIDNVQDVTDAAYYYMDQELLKFTLQFPGARTYVGFHAIPLDGAIQTVTWSLAESGIATTIANRNREDFYRGVPYVERQRMVLMDQIRNGAAEADTNVLERNTGQRRFGLTDVVYVR